MQGKRDLDEKQRKVFHTVENERELPSQGKFKSKRVLTAQVIISIKKHL